MAKNFNPFKQRYEKVLKIALEKNFDLLLEETMSILAGYESIVTDYQFLESSIRSLESEIRSLEARLSESKELISEYKENLQNSNNALQNIYYQVSMGGGVVKVETDSGCQSHTVNSIAPNPFGNRQATPLSPALKSRIDSAKKQGMRWNNKKNKEPKSDVDKLREVEHWENGIKEGMATDIKELVDLDISEIYSDRWEDKPRLTGICISIENDLGLNSVEFSYLKPRIKNRIERFKKKMGL